MFFSDVDIEAALSFPIITQLRKAHKYHSQKVKLLCGMILEKRSIAGWLICTKLLSKADSALKLFVQSLGTRAEAKVQNYVVSLIAVLPE